MSMHMQLTIFVVEVVDEIFRGFFAPLKAKAYFRSISFDTHAYLIFVNRKSKT